jgi:hypothetical protein
MDPAIKPHSCGLFEKATSPQFLPLSMPVVPVARRSYPVDPHELLCVIGV